MQATIERPAIGETVPGYISRVVRPVVRVESWGPCGLGLETIDPRDAAADGWSATPEYRVTTLHTGINSRGERFDIGAAPAGFAPSWNCAATGSRRAFCRAGFWPSSAGPALTPARGNARSGGVRGAVDRRPRTWKPASAGTGRD